MEPDRLATSEVFPRRLPAPRDEFRQKLRRRRGVRSVFPVLVLYSCIIVVSYVGTCAFPRLLDQIDGQYAGAAHEMIARHDWLVPTQNSIPRLRKPPLTYWLEIMSFETLGQNEFAARIPICLATLGWFVVTGMLAYECTRDKVTGLASAVILATFFGAFQFSHLVMPEPIFGFLITCCFWLLVRLRKTDLSTSGVKRDLLLLWVSMALAVLCKGLHGLLLPLGVLSVTSIFQPALRSLWRRVFLSKMGWATFAILVIPWYAAVESRYPGFTLDQLGNEQANMLLDRRWPTDGCHLPLFGFWVEQLAALFPWSLLIPGSALTSFRYLATKKCLPPDALLLLLWFTIYAVAITFANLQDYYLLTCFPVIAIWLAWSIKQGIPKLSSSILPGGLLILLGIVGIVVGGLQLAPIVHQGKNVSGQQPAINSVATALVNISSSTNRSLTFVILGFGICAIGAGVLLIFLRRRNQVTLVLLPPFVVAICLLGIAVEVALQDYLSSASLALAIDQNVGPDTLIVSHGTISDRTSLYFYMRRQLHWLGGDPDQEYATRRYGKGKDLYLTMADLTAAWNSARRVCVILDRSSLSSLSEALGIDPKAVRTLVSTPTDVVIENRE